MKDEITDMQAVYALKGTYRSGNHLYPIARYLREAYRQGLIQDIS
jgi:hypothetical protein